ncbi:hypothetical protein D3C85_986640 [compost metagenome]
MTAHLVQHQYSVFIQVVDKVLQPLQQNFVATFTVGTQHRVFQIADIIQRDPITSAFAARLVVTPDYVESCTLEYIQQAFFILCLAGVVILAPHVGKHARHRYGGFRAARMHIGERDQTGFFIQLRRGVAVITEDAEILGPGTFTHHQNGQGLATVVLPDGVSLGIFTELSERLLRRRNLFTQVTERGADVVARHHHKPQLMVIAEQRRKALVVNQRHTTNHRRRCNTDQHLT